MKMIFESAMQRTRVANVVRLIAQYAAEASLGKIMIRDRHERLKFFTRNVAKYTKRALDAMKFEVVPVGYDADLMAERNFLLVGNHLSYLDILVTSSIQPMVFVTSVDMGEQFFLGPMAELGGSIFVERRHRSQIGRDLGVMADTLRAGHHVMIYPEGTSSNGEGVLPFKKSLLMAAVESSTDIMPVVVRYTHIDGEPFGPSNRDRVCWYGDMSFGSHFAGVAKVKSVRAEVHFLDPITVTKDSNRQELAEKAYRIISETYLYGRAAGSSGERPTYLQ